MRVFVLVFISLIYCTNAFFWNENNKEPPVAPKPQYAIQDYVPSEKPRFYLVVGPESAGNRYTVKMMIHMADCFGKSGHDQPFDDKLGITHHKKKISNWSQIDFTQYDLVKKSCAVMHRSMPHEGEIVNIDYMVQQIRDHGMEPYILITYRSEPHMIMSQITNKHTNSVQESAQNIDSGMYSIFEAITRTKTKFQIVVYELLNERFYYDWLKQRLELTGSGTSTKPLVFQSQNYKYDLKKLGLNENDGSLHANGPVAIAYFNNKEGHINAVSDEKMKQIFENSPITKLTARYNMLKRI